jgi:hypothetical protein
MTASAATIKPLNIGLWRVRGFVIWKVCINSNVLRRLPQCAEAS